MSKTQKTPFFSTKPPQNPPSDGPICLVNELKVLIALLHVYTKFNQNRTIFARVIVSRDTYINIYI